MRYFCLLLLWSLWLSPFSLANNTNVLPTAYKYYGVKETSKNSSEIIDKFNEHVGVPKGSNWCASFVSYVLDEVGVSYPTVRSAVARKFITEFSIKAKHVYKGYAEVYPGWLAIWQHGNTWRGHIGFVIWWHRLSGKTIEGNTNNKVDIQYRKLELSKYFRITHFTPVHE